MRTKPDLQFFLIEKSIFEMSTKEVTVVEKAVQRRPLVEPQRALILRPGRNNPCFHDVEDFDLMANRNRNIRPDRYDDGVADANDHAPDRANHDAAQGGAAQLRAVNGPALFHKVKNQKSILAIVISNSRVFAGTQGGELLVHEDVLFWI